MPKPAPSTEEKAVETVDPAKEQREIEIDDNNQVVKPEPKKTEPQYVTLDQLEKIQKGINYQNTAARKLEEKIERLLNQIPAPATPQTEQAPVNEWDLKLQQNWKGTVEELAEQRFNQLMEKQKREAAVAASEQRRVELFERSKRQVMERHPDLADDAGEKSKMYQQIVTENPDYITDPFGPVLAMHDMETKLRELGKFDLSTQNLVKKEVARQARAGAGAVPAGASPSGNSKIVLSKDDLEFCKTNGISPENYAREKKMLSERQKGQ